MRLLRALLAAAQPALGLGSFGFPRTIGGAISDWVLKAGVEMDVWSHNVTSAAGLQHGAYLNHFWSAGGKGPVGTYIADRQLVRYYVDGERQPSIEFEPAMACGSGIGYERLGYYQAGHNMKEPWGPEMSNTMMGHSARSVRPPLAHPAVPSHPTSHPTADCCLQCRAVAGTTDSWFPFHAASA